MTLVAKALNPEDTLLPEEQTKSILSPIHSSIKRHTERAVFLTHWARGQLPPHSLNKDELLDVA